MVKLHPHYSLFNISRLYSSYSFHASISEMPAANSMATRFSNKAEIYSVHCVMLTRSTVLYHVLTHSHVLYNHAGTDRLSPMSIIYLSHLPLGSYWGWSNLISNLCSRITSVRCILAIVHTTHLLTTTADRCFPWRRQEPS